MCVFVCVYTWGRRVRGDYKTYPQLGLLVCFHGEVKIVLKKWPHPIIKDGGHIAHDGSDDDENDKSFCPRSSFPWQWVNDFLVRECELEW